MSWPIHSELMEPVAAAIAPVISGLRTICDPVVPYYGPEGTVLTTASQVRRLLGTEFCYPTLWNASFQGMVDAGIREFVEVGPGDMLCKMTRWIDRSTRCVPAERSSGPGGRGYIPLVTDPPRDPGDRRSPRDSRRPTIRLESKPTAGPEAGARGA